MDCLNDFTAQQNIPVPVWGLQYANDLLNEREAESGWNPSSAGVRLFSLQSRAEEANEPTSRRKPVSILLVEDNPADVTLVREALEEHGVEGELIVASDGEKALRVMEEIESHALACPDLFIIDLNIPKRPGREVVECMRGTAKCGQAAVVILSSSDSERDKEDARRLGVRLYIRKPSRLDEFLALGAIFRGLLDRSTE